MLSTAIYPAYSPKPAAFARPLATRELRVRLGFRGVSISDALGTVSAGAFGGPAKAGLAAAKAGTDLLLFTDYHAGARAYRGAASQASLRRSRPGPVRALGAARPRPSAPPAGRDLN